MKILLVDDDADTLKLATLLVEMIGYEPVATHSPYQALDILANQPIQLAIIDWMMPMMSGIELVQRIRAQFSERYIYIIMLTALRSREDVATGLESGVDDYVTKPFDHREFKARLKIGERIVLMESNLNQSINKMKDLAEHDHLTQLLNRRRVMELATEWMNQSEQYPITLVMADIDHFKRVNDIYGHQNGDKALRMVAELLKSHAPNAALVGRYGGEEFMLVLPKTSGEKASLLCEQIRRAVESASFYAEQERIQVTISMGCAMTETPLTLEELIHPADEALYTAKHKGRNQVVLANLDKSITE